MHELVSIDEVSRRKFRLPSAFLCLLDWHHLRLCGPLEAAIRGRAERNSRRKKNHAKLIPHMTMVPFGSKY
jgi:hypothetical protein